MNNTPNSTSRFSPTPDKTREQLLDAWIPSATANQLFEVFKDAVQMRWLEGAQKLAPLVSPDQLNTGLMLSVHHKNGKMMKLLLPFANLQNMTKSTLIQLLYSAVHYNMLDATKTLLQHLTPAEVDDSLLVRAVNNNFLKLIPILLSHCDAKAHGSHALSHAASNNDMQAVQLLLPHSDLQADNCHALAYSLECKTNDMFKFLLPLSTSKIANSEALIAAVNDQNAEAVQLLIPVSDPKARNSKALEMAAMHPSLEIFNMLLPVSDPNADGCEALNTALLSRNAPMVDELLKYCDITHRSNALADAAKSGNFSLLIKLLPISDPLHDSSKALRQALIFGHDDCIDLLYAVSDVDAAKKDAVEYLSQKNKSASIPEIEARLDEHLAIAKGRDDKRKMYR